MCFFELVEVHQDARETNVRSGKGRTQFDRLAIKIGGFFNASSPRAFSRDLGFLKQQFGLIGGGQEFYGKRTTPGSSGVVVSFKPVGANSEPNAGRQRLC